MKTTMDILLILYQVVSSSSVKDAITGSIYKTQRPLNSDKEDVVIECGKVEGQQIQKCNPTITVHVPNKKVFINQVQDLSQPDTQRLDLLTDLIWQEVENRFYDTYWFFAVSQEQHAEGNEHYSTITIDFNYYNSN